MHTLTTWEQETPFQRTKRFVNWYNTYSQYEKEPTTITVHQTWSQYGGPEEGGWDFLCGYPIETICIFSKSQAIRVLHELHEKYNTPEYDDNLYDINLSNSYAQFYPSKRPHYE